MDQLKTRVERLAARLSEEGRNEDAALCAIVVASLKSADEGYRQGFNDALKHAIDLIQTHKSGPRDNGGLPDCAIDRLGQENVGLS